MGIVPGNLSAQCSSHTASESVVTGETMRGTVVGVSIVTGTLTVKLHEGADNTGRLLADHRTSVISALMFPVGSQPEYDGGLYVDISGTGTAIVWYT